MSAHTRFDCPSAPLALRSLLKRAREPLWLGLGLAVAAHGVLSQLSAQSQRHKAAKPLTTQFVKRQPRLTKPLEMKKRPQPRQRRLRRTTVAVKAEADRQQGVGVFVPAQVLYALARPHVRLGRAATFDAAVFDPRSVAQVIEGGKEPKSIMDMSLEMLDIGDLDIGNYHALVIQDAGDKRSIRGFCHLAIAKLRDAFPEAGDYSFERHALPGFLRLSIIMNTDTDIKTDVLGRVNLDDADLFKVPWLFLNARRSFRLTDAELRNLGGYMMRGGFVFSDGVGVLRATNWSPGLVALYRSLMDALKTQGVEAALEVLPDTHPVFHCYFDFDGPPIGGDGAFVHGSSDVYRIVPYLEGVQVDGRLLATFSRKDYSHAWTYWGPDNFLGYGDWKTWDPIQPLRFGANTIIFALTQEGSITNRLMDSVSY